MSPIEHATEMPKIVRILYKVFQTATIRLAIAQAPRFKDFKTPLRIDPPIAYGDHPLVRFLKASLILAGIYNLAWGGWVVLFPAQFWDMVHLPVPNYMSLWQCIGMIVGVYGIGYLAAASDPLRHWPIVLVGLLGKIFGPIGFVSEALHGTLPWRFGVINIFNDLIWWVPFAMILLAAYKQRKSNV